MTLALDSSALIQRYLPGPDRNLILRAMEQASEWCASELVRTEVMLALHRIATSRTAANDLWAAARADWDAFVVVPVDGQCLSTAADLGSEYGLTTVDAIHLAAASRLPPPIRYATFDPSQIPAAAAMGFDVIAPVMK